MKTIKIAFSIILSGLSIGAVAQSAPATISPQYTRSYTLSEVTSLAKTIDKTNIKENVFCSFVDTETNSSSNIKRVFALNSTGVVSSKTLTYLKNASSSSTQSAATRSVSLHSGSGVSPILTTSLQGFSPLATGASGNMRTFNYNVAGKTKSVIATSSGFFFSFGGSNYWKGC